MENMLSLMEGEDWKRIRSIVTPAFTSGRLRKMKGLIDECIAILMKNYDKELVKNGDGNCGDVDVKRIFGAYSMEVILTVVFGTKVDSLDDPDNLIVKNAKSI